MKWLFSLSVVLTMAGAAVADQQVERIFQRVLALNPGLQDFSAQLDINLQADMGLIHYKPKLQGKYFFKQADHHKVELSGGPKEIRKYPMIFGFNLPQIHRFESNVVEETVYKGRPVFHCRLVPKWRGDNIRHMDLLIDQQAYTVAQTATTYRNEGTLTLDVEYTKVGNFTVFDSLRVNADFPSMSATANGEAKYSHYAFNQNLPNSLFNPAPKKVSLEK